MREVAERVPCPYCGQPKGEDCVTKSGNRTVSSHEWRWQTYQSMAKTEEMVFEKREDEPRFGLFAGDLLLCIKYPYDSKVTVLRRLSDDYDPQCNQYTSEVKFIDFYRYYEENNGS